MRERLGAKPWQFQGITGRRKGTSYYCVPCAVWHPTHRGVGTPCPLGGEEPGGAPVNLASAAIIPRERLGTQRKRVRIPFRVEGITH